MAARFDERRLNHYVRRGHRQVRGWFAGFSAQVLAATSSYQLQSGIRGAVAEIGVHHGKLFLVLYLSTAQDEKALAIDVFRLQHLNVDQSGKGDLEVFFKNVDRYAGGREGLQIIEDSSLNVTPQKVISTVGRVRLFSIDGSHTHEATMNDLRLAEATLTPEGVLVVDDCFCEFWPEVSGAICKYLHGGGALVPYAITPGKVFLCAAAMKPRYVGLLRDRFALRVEKQARLFGHESLIVGVLPWTLRGAIGRTALGGFLKRVRNSMRRAAAS